MNNKEIIELRQQLEQQQKTLNEQQKTLSEGLAKLEGLKSLRIKNKVSNERSYKDILMDQYDQLTRAHKVGSTINSHAAAKVWGCSFSQAYRSLRSLELLEVVRDNNKKGAGTHRSTEFILLV